MKSLESKLACYLPLGTAPVIATWISRTACEFRISRPRSSKFGDYSPPYGGQGHRISVNRNLNPFAFLVTTVHEFAHLKTWLQFKGRVKPHGSEWKRAFSDLMRPFLEGQVFPQDLQTAILAYLKNPAASSCTDLQLFRALSRYDQLTTTSKGTIASHRNHLVHLESLAEGQLFQTKDGRTFQKLQRIRVRHRCIELKTKRIYSFSPVAAVQPLTEH